MTCERLADLLDPYLDGETDALTARTVEEHLGHCGACSRQLAARRALQAALREKLPRYSAPAALPEAILQAVDGAGARAAHRPEARRRVPVFRYAAAAVVLLAAGLFVGLALRPNGQDRMMALAQAVETDHLRSLQEQHLLDVVSTDQHTVKPWFAGRVPFSPAVPDLAGFPLKGGRLDWLEGRQAIALVYGRNQHVINLFIWPGKEKGLSATAVTRTTASGHHLVCWQEGGEGGEEEGGTLNFCAISDVEAAQLSEFASAYRAAAGQR